MNKFKVAVVGAGAVGEELIKVLNDLKFPYSEIKILARSERVQNINGVDYKVYAISNDAFADVDIAFFAGTEGSKGASQIYGWEAVKKGCFVIDNGDDYRMDPNVPLVVPEVNGYALENCKGFVANPNCSTIQMVHALAPLNAISKIKRIVVTTFQSVSGTGSDAIKELREQIKAYNEGKEIEVRNYPYQIFCNVIPQISSLKDEFEGYYGEEIKMIKETRKIFGNPDINVSATCVRVPVFRAHSEAVNVEFESRITAGEAKEAISKWEGLELLDNPAESIYPMPLFAEGKNPTYVGRVREDSGNTNTLDLWIVADNIRKGAALNSVQIAQKAIEMGIIKPKNR